MVKLQVNMWNTEFERISGNQNYSLNLTAVFEIIYIVVEGLKGWWVLMSKEQTQLNRLSIYYEL